MSDDVNLNKENCAKDFARRCEKIALERNTISDTQDAMSNPNFKKDFHLLMDKLASETRAAMPLTKRPARFTVMLGRYKTKQKMIKSVTGKGHKISDYGLSVINNKQFLMLQKPEEYEFIWTTVKELTGKDSVTTTELYQFRDRAGYIDAPHESACAIREIYGDQPMNEWVSVLSQPVTASDGYLNILSVGRYAGGSCVRRRYAFPGYVWFGGSRLLLCRKKQVAA